MKKLILFGVIKFKRNEGSLAKCNCCVGNHIYSEYVEFDDDAYNNGERQGDLINSYISGNNKQEKNEMENKQIKITLEVE